MAASAIGGRWELGPTGKFSGLSMQEVMGRGRFEARFVDRTARDHQHLAPPVWARDEVTRVLERELADRIDRVDSSIRVAYRVDLLVDHTPDRGSRGALPFTQLVEDDLFLLRELICGDSSASMGDTLGLDAEHAVQVCR